MSTKLSRLPWLLALLATGCLVTPARALLPEPDHVVYGTIYVGTNQMTAVRTNIVVELRRATNGPAISSYRMGDNPGFGDFYSVNVMLESLDPNSYLTTGLLDTNAALPGDTLFLVVKDRTITRYVTNFVVGVPGSLQRIDFGNAPTNNLPLFDQWLVSSFGSTNVARIGPKGSVTNDYIAGTNPNDTNSLFKLNVIRNGTTEISFHGIRAEGPGYTGLTRRYDLESCTNLTAGTWRGVPGYTNLVGNNQTILYLAPTNASTGPFYRAQVRLTNP